MSRVFSAFLLMLSAVGWAQGGQSWDQIKFDSRRSGNVPQRSVTAPLRLVGAVPLADALFTSPVIADGRICAVDGSGTAWGIDARSLQVVWKYPTRGGKANCNNVSSPTLVKGKLHFGTSAGWYYVLEAASGKLVRATFVGEPIFSSPVTSGDRVYFATLGSQVHCVGADGAPCWKWDFVAEVLKFTGDRFNSQDWLKHKQGRVTWRDQFCCPIDIAAVGKRIVVPAGGRIVWLDDAGDRPVMRAIGEIPAYSGKEYPSPFGLSLGEDGTVFCQFHRRDNSGRVEILRLADGKVSTDFVRGTETSISLPGLMSFTSVSVRGDDVYRVRPEAELALCRHTVGQERTQRLDGFPSISSPILLGDQAVYGGLDGALYVVPLGGEGKAWSFRTAFGRPITAPAAVCDGRVYFGCEDGYLYVLGPDGHAPLPTKDLELHAIRSPLGGPMTDSKYDWPTNWGDDACTNANRQGIKPPLAMKWIRRYEGTYKHLPVCGGGRMYTHTAEGQIFAVEQETGRLLWRVYYPDVYLSFTSPHYHEGKLIVPQAGMKRSLVRCLDAATGRLLWQAPFSGSPSWSRQQPPVIHKNLVIYGFGTGKYAAQGPEKAYIFSGKPVPNPDGQEVMSWIYTHDNPYYPKDNRPLVRAWDLATGKVVWDKDFSEHGSGGNDTGLCLMDGTLYYSTFFGYAAKRKGEPGPKGLTVAMDPATGRVKWLNTKCSVTAGCTISGRDGRLYVGGYNRPDESTKDRFVRCLDARDGSLVWQSDPLPSAVNVVTVGQQFLFTYASGRDGHLLDRATGKIVSKFNLGTACTRFTLSEPYLVGTNMDLVDLSDGNKVVASGPAVDSRECMAGVVSNGRIFYTSQASGLQVCQLAGEEAKAFVPPWKARK